MCVMSSRHVIEVQLADSLPTSAERRGGKSAKQPFVLTGFDVCIVSVSAGSMSHALASIVYECMYSWLAGGCELSKPTNDLPIFVLETRYLNFLEMLTANC